MKNTKKFVISIVLFLSLVFAGVGVFFVNDTVYAQSEHTVTIQVSYETKKTTTVAHGANITESILDDVDLPVVPDYNYVWFWRYSEGDSIHTFSLTDDDVDDIIVENVTGDIVLYSALFVDPSSRHTVIFKLPDGSEVTKYVNNGDQVEAPVVNLGFCERLVFDKNLENVRTDMVVNVTIDSTWKYVFMVGCVVALLVSIAVIVFVVLKVVKVPDDDEEEEENI